MQNLDDVFKPLTSWQTLGYEGTIDDDGSSLMTRLCPDGIDSFTRICWRMNDFRAELNDYPMWYCVSDGSGEEVRAYFSSFRKKFRYAFESDHQMRERWVSEIAEPSLKRRLI